MHRLQPYFQKPLLIFAVVVFTYVTVTWKLRFRRENHNTFTTAVNIQHIYEHGLNVSLKPPHWGLKGHRVRQLGHWATYLTKHSNVDSKAFDAALIQEFPWLAGSNALMVTPWGNASARAHFQSCQTGIVTCVGSSNYHLAAHLIVSLRRVHNSSLPPEVAYSGDEDLKPEHREFLQSLGFNTSFINLLEYPVFERN